MHTGKSGLKVAILFCAAAAAGCGGSSSGTGTVSVSLMDRPVDNVTALYVTIDKVRIKRQGDGPAEELPMTTAPLTVDLLSLTDENAAVLVDEAIVEAGTYNWVEFVIDDSDITKSYAMTTTGEQTPVDVDVPSGSIRLVSPFEVAENQAVRFLFDWEVSTGLTEAVGRNLYILKPAFRILNADAYSSISGRLTSATASDPALCVANDMTGSKVVYFFEGDVTPDDIDGTDPDPVTTADAKFDEVSGDYLFRAVLMPGDYTVALTCLGEGETDTENVSEDFLFLSPLSGDTVVTLTGAAPLTDVDF